ncbi:MAG: DUF2156 domain-containing protein [Deltaproteobacteria bacterium]|nr:DUF2156 domain-containing protein [Deltaproteobacteria bacterium]
MTDIDRYPYWRPLDLNHGVALQKALRDSEPQSSELTFTNLFMWRIYYGLQISMQDETILLKAEPEDQPSFLLPTVGPPLDPVRLRDIVEALGPDGCIARADAAWIKRNPGLKGSFGTTADRDQFDYVYRTEDLISLSGRKFHRKKNHLNRFLKTYEFTYDELNPDMTDACLRLAEEWCQVRNCEEHPSLKGEERAIREALLHWSHLPFRGGAIFIDGRLEAFSLGEHLNSGTAVIHIEKANADYQGIYAALNQLFVQHAWSHTEFINREQDLGEPNIRKAKESYVPYRFIEKYRLIPK